MRCLCNRFYFLCNRFSNCLPHLPDRSARLVLLYMCVHPSHVIHVCPSVRLSDRTGPDCHFICVCPSAHLGWTGLDQQPIRGACMCALVCLLPCAYVWIYARLSSSNVCRLASISLRAMDFTECGFAGSFKLEHMNENSFHSIITATTGETKDAVWQMQGHANLSANVSGECRCLEKHFSPVRFCVFEIETDVNPGVYHKATWYLDQEVTGMRQG